MLLKEKIGISIIPTSNFEEDYRLAIKAIDNGIKIITLSDYHKGNDYKPLMIQIAKKDITIGTAVTNFSINNPMDVCNFFLSIHGINKNVFMGIGTGDWQFLHSKGITTKEAIMKLIKGVQLAKEFFNSKKVKVPIYLGAQGKHLINLSKKIADGVILNLANSEYIDKALEILKDCEKDFKKYVIAQTFIENEDKALENARKSACLIYAGLSDSAVKYYGFEYTKRNYLRKLLVEGKTDEARKLLTNEEIKKLTICGTIEEVREHVIKILEIDIDCLILGLPFGKERYTTFENLIKLI